MKFLVVDDDATARDLVTDILIGAGYSNVKTAADGSEALKLIKAAGRPFDCLILDVEMPRINGMELCRLTRALPEYETTPILMLTANADEGTISRAFAAGATDYTIKPFNFIELLERVQLALVLREPRQSRELARARPHLREVLMTHEALLTRAALENFTRTCRVQEHLAAAAIVVHIPLGHGLGGGEVAQALMETLPRSQVFATYLGAGDYLTVCDRIDAVQEDQFAKTFRAQLARQRSDLTEEDLQDVEIGCWSYPSRFERAKDLAFLDRAVTNRYGVIPAKPKAPAPSFMARLFTFL